MIALDKQFEEESTMEVLVKWSSRRNRRAYSGVGSTFRGQNYVDALIFNGFQKFFFNLLVIE